MIDPCVLGTANPLPADLGGYICPITAVFAGGECGAAESVVSVSEIRTRALSQSAKPGRPRILRELRKHIGRMWEANPTWGSPKIVAELAMLGIEVANELHQRELDIINMIYCHVLSRDELVAIIGLG